VRECRALRWRSGHDPHARVTRRRTLAQLAASPSREEAFRCAPYPTDLSAKGHSGLRLVAAGGGWQRFREIGAGSRQRTGDELARTADRTPRCYDAQPEMARTQPTKLDVKSRQPAGSRAARRLRRAGLVPGVVYGAGDPVGFAVDARVLRQALAAKGAVLDLSVDGAAPTPVVLKDAQRDAIHGETLHVDLVRVRLDRPIHAAVPLELTGAEESPGVKEGGVLEQITRELNIEALPTAIPEAITHDVSAMEINETLTLEAIVAPAGVTLLDDPEQTVIATLTPPRLQVEEEPEIEEETELVGEEAAEGEAPEGEGEAEAAAQAPEGGSE